MSMLRSLLILAVLPALVMAAVLTGVFTAVAHIEGFPVTLPLDFMAFPIGLTFVMGAASALIDPLPAPTPKETPMLKRLTLALLGLFAALSISGCSQVGDAADYMGEPSYCHSQTSLDTAWEDAYQDYRATGAYTEDGAQTAATVRMEDLMEAYC